MCAAECLCALDVIKLKVTMTITLSGIIKADRKGKASGLENLRPYHRIMATRFLIAIIVCKKDANLLLTVY